VTVPAPQASFAYGSNGYGYVTFDASGSTAYPGTSIASYNWDFGDGNSYQTSYAQYNYQYANYGQQYTVTLTVTDALGQTSNPFTQTITV
jgi:PKD repeat protein